MSILSVEEQINRLKTSLEIDKAAGAKVIIDNRLLNIVGVMSDLQDSLHETQVKLEKLSIKVTGIEVNYL